MRTQPVREVLKDVPEVERIQRAESEVERELQPGFARSGCDPLVLLEEHDAKTVESRVVQRQPVLRLVHAEPTWPARSRREEHELVDDLLAQRPCALARAACQQAADGENVGLHCPGLRYSRPGETPQVWSQKTPAAIPRMGHRFDQAVVRTD
jgi:hypothetical protein